MPEELTVAGVDRITAGNTDCWSVTYIRGDGSKLNHVFPVDALAWRAAEYDIDLADTATLLDIVLHEPHMPDPSHVDPPAAAAIGPAGVPTTLATAASRADARAAHLARIEHTKKHIIRIAPSATGRGTDPLRKIHDTAPDHARYREIRDHLADSQRSLKP
jgi:hypothetical protein